MECKYKYKLLSPIKIKLCVCLLQFFFFILLRDMRCTTLWSTCLSPALLSCIRFFYPVFQCRQSLCSVRSPWIALDHVTTYHQTVLSRVAETLLYQSIATPNGPGGYLASRIPCRQQFWFSCQWLVQVLWLWCIHCGVMLPSTGLNRA